MIDKRRLGTWIGIIVVLACCSWTGYYFLNRPPVESAGEAVTLTKEAAAQAALARKEGKDIRNRQYAAQIFREILRTPPETLVVTAVLKGDSDSALRAAKIWEMTEPGNPIALSLLEAFKRTRTCGIERCSARLTGYRSDQDFNTWLAGIKNKYPGNSNVILMTTGDAADSKAFAAALKNKDSNLDFNFSAELCAPWIGADTTARLRKDWENTRSTPAALRLVQRLTCRNDSFRAPPGDMEEALQVLEAAVKTSPETDLESIRDAYLWAKKWTTE